MMHRRAVGVGKSAASQGDADYTGDSGDIDRKRGSRSGLTSFAKSKLGLAVGILVLVALVLTLTQQKGITSGKSVFGNKSKSGALQKNQIRRDELPEEPDEVDLKGVVGDIPKGDDEVREEREGDIALPVEEVQDNKDPFTGKEVEYHIIFSTGCSIYQDWQSYLFFFFAMKSKQPGTITRIVSGCDPEDQDKLQKFFDETIHPMSPEGRFKIHFTPDYSHLKGKFYPYFNKRKCAARMA
jgi:hypothetical protein